MNTEIHAKRGVEVSANTSQCRIQMFATLLAKNCISYTMLLRNIVDVVRYDQNLTVNAVLIITDKQRYQAANVNVVDYEDALVALRCAEDIRTRSILITAISDVMKTSW